MVQKWEEKKLRTIVVLIKVCNYILRYFTQFNTLLE